MTKGGGVGTLPHPNLPPEGEGISRDPAPLGSCLRGIDDGGVRAVKWCRAKGGDPALAGRPPSSALRTGFESLRVIGFANRPYGALRGEWVDSGGAVVGLPLAAPPLWIPAFAGMTKGVGQDRRRGWGGNDEWVGMTRWGRGMAQWGAGTTGTGGGWLGRQYVRGGPLGGAAPYESPCWLFALRRALGERVCLL